MDPVVDMNKGRLSKHWQFHSLYNSLTVSGFVKVLAYRLRFFSVSAVDGCDTSVCFSYMQTHANGERNAHARGDTHARTHIHTHAYRNTHARTHQPTHARTRPPSPPPPTHTYDGTMNLSKEVTTLLFALILYAGYALYIEKHSDCVEVYTTIPTA